MKKFVSIVIALVMVLSMTSAFALNNCSTPSFGWDCYTATDYCGKGSVEIVPYVKVNSACDGWAWQVSDCAAAINTDKVYYAVAMTVEENPDPEWWAAAKLTIEAEGVKTLELNKANAWGTGVVSDDETNVFYLAKDANSWINVKDWNKLAAKDQAAYIFEAKVVEADVAEVCATLESYNSGVGIYNWGDWWVNSSALTFDADGKADGTLRIQKEGAGVVTYTIVDGEVTAVAGAKADVEEANSVFNLGCGWVCVIKDAIEANFGWDDEQEDCFAWSDKGAAVVNPECSVEIPKTGDVSVVAYAVMAIVAAAGTMLKK